jgi:hypothetical protein
METCTCKQSEDAAQCAPARLIMLSKLSHIHLLLQLLSDKMHS